jgi:hypothetical protein
MSNPTWNGGSDNWASTPSDWSTDQEPGAADDVTINQGDPQVTTNVGAVNSLTDNSSLSIEDSGSLTAVAGVANTGFLGIDNNGSGGGSTLTIGGALTNSSTVVIGSGDGFGALNAPATVTAQGLCLQRKPIQSRFLVGRTAH